jgi:tetratricopeptide (TPR) repeat protein
MIHLRSFLLTAVLLAPLVAHAGDSADRHIAKATEAHQAGRFADALAELQTAYSLDPRPSLLYAIGQVDVKLDRCADAITYYDRYLATHPDASSTTETEEAIATCKAKLAAAASPPATDSPFLPPSSTSSPAPARRPWYTDKLGDALVGSGVVVAVVGIVVYRSARSDLDSAETAPDLRHYQDLVDSAHSKRTWSIVLIGGGAALIGGGIFHYMRRDRGTETPGVGMVPTTGGGLVTWMGQF